LKKDWLWATTTTACRAESSHAFDLMAERKKPVFIVATANEITRFAARNGPQRRFDEIFLRLAITAHAVTSWPFISKRCLDPAQFDLEELAKAAGRLLRLGDRASDRVVHVQCPRSGAGTSRRPIC